MSGISLFHWQPILHARHWKINAFEYLDFVVFLFKQHCYNLTDHRGKRETPSCASDHVGSILLGEGDGKRGRPASEDRPGRREERVVEKEEAEWLTRGHSCSVVADGVVRTLSRSEYCLGPDKLILPGDKPTECLNANMHELLFHLLFGNFICESFWCFRDLKWQKTSSESTECPLSLARSLSSRGSELLALIDSGNGLVCTSLLSSSPDPFCLLASENPILDKLKTLVGFYIFLISLFPVLLFYCSPCPWGLPKSHLFLWPGKVPSCFWTPPVYHIL